MTRADVAVGLLLAALAGLPPGGCRAPGPRGFAAPATRAVWVTRFDYRSEADVRRVLGDCAAAGFNTVLFQVRGNGTAFYRSRLEPRADELRDADPEFDPLATACGEARRLGLALHAWINVMPSWRGAAPPADPRQLYNRRPEWHLFDTGGRRQELVAEFYVSLNPCLPEVRDYLVAVAREIVAGYDVAGLHLDYIRYVDELVEQERDLPADPRTVALFHAATGLAPAADPAAWRRWRADQVTLLVTEIGAMMRRVRPGAALSAAVGAAPEEATDRHMRDSRRWAEEGLVDALFPMNYTADRQLFRARLAAWRAVRTRARVVTGLMARLDDRTAGTVLAELDDVLGSSPHFCVFAYSHLFGAAAPAGSREGGAQSLLERIRALGTPALP